LTASQYSESTNYAGTGIDIIDLFLGASGATTTVDYDRNFKDLYERAMSAMISGGYQFDMSTEEGQRYADIMARHTAENGTFDNTVVWTVDEVLDWGKMIAQNTAGEKGTTFSPGQGITIEYGGTDFNRSQVTQYNERIAQGIRYNYTETVETLDNLIKSHPDAFGGATSAADYFEWGDEAPDTKELNVALNKV